MGSISGDVLSGMRRRQLYSTIYALKREVNCLSTDLMRYQLISRKCENYLTDLRNVGHVCSGFDHRLRLESLTLEINVLKDTKSCFILMQNHLQVFNDFLANHTDRMSQSIGSQSMRQLMSRRPNKTRGNEHLIRAQIRDQISRELTKRHDFRGSGKSLTEVNDKKSPSKRKRLNHLVCHWNGCEKRYKFRHHLEAHKLLHRGMTYRCDRRGCSATFASPVYLKVHQSRTQPRADGQGCAAKGKGFQRTITKSLKANTKRQHKLIDSKAKRIENNIEVIEWKTIGKKPKLIENKRNSIEIKPKTSEIKPKSIESKHKISKTVVQKNVAKDSQRDAKEFKVLDECDVSHGLNDKIKSNSVDDKHITSQSSGDNKLFDDWFVCKYKECGEWFANEESYVYHKRMHELVVKRRVQRTVPMTVPPVPRFVTISKSDRSHGVAIDKPTDSQHKCPVNGCDEMFDSMLSIRSHLKRRHPKELLDVPWIQCQRTGCRFKTKMKVDFNRHVANDHKKSAKAVPDTGPQLKPISHTLYRLYKSDDSSTVESTDRQFMCEIKECGQAFKTSYALDGHHKRKHPHSFPEIPWIDCRYKGCLFQSKCNIYMSSHMSRHKTVRSPPGPKSAKMSRAAKEWKYRCDSHGCDYATRFERNLSAHKRVRHPENSLSDRRVKSVGSVAHVSEYQCDRHGCDYTTRFKHILNEHQLSHSADSGFKCGINECRKVYGSKTALMAHQKKRHPDECGAKSKDWWCDWDACRRVFNSEKALKLHMKAHTHRTCEAIPYRCDWDGCDQTFSIKSVLDVHLKEHLLAEDFGVPAPVFDDEMKVDVKQEPIDTMTVNVIQESIDDNIIEFNSNCNNNSNNNETTAATPDFKLMSEVLLKQIKTENT